MTEVDERILAGLNPAQREAVTTVRGPVLVLAGPGSGKTRVLAHRVAYLLRVVGVAPRAVMAVTFTNKAAGEMRERINRLLGESAGDRSPLADAEPGVPMSSGWRGLTIGTFHSICARILRVESSAAGISPNYVIYDDGEQLATVRKCLRDLGLDEKLYRPEAMRSAISRAKNELIKPQDYAAKTYWEEVARRLYVRYDEILQANGALDFDDLLTRTTWLFQEQPDVLKRYQERYEHLLVDEFQDTNTAQYELVRLLAGRSHNLFAVGDEDQSIYAFRGADYRNVVRFREDFPEVRIVLLEHNYRSTQTILDAANAVIAKNHRRTPKKLRTDRGRGVEVVVHEAYDEADEASFVASTIQRLVRQPGASLRDCAVMYRTNAQSRSLEDAFVARGMPYRLVGGVRFYQRREIKDALAYLRVVHNPADNLGLTRIINVPPRAIGERTVAALAAWSDELGVSMAGALALLAGDLAGPFLGGDAPARFGEPPEHPFAAAARRSLLGFHRLLAGWVAAAQTLTVAALLDRIVEESGYATWLRDGTEVGDDRWENLQELRTVAMHYDDFPRDLRLTAFLEEVALVSDQDELVSDDDRVTLLTVHAAKGLEFKAVFMVGLEENVFPHSRSLADSDQMEEERRLMYVGVTRARDRLYLVRAFRRTLYGRSEINGPSRFLADVSAALGRAEGGALIHSGTGGADRGPRFDGGAVGRMSHASWHRPQPSTGRARAGAVRRPYGEPRAAGERMPQEPSRPCEFKPGDRVDHGLFGQGIVLKSEATGDDEEVTVAFAGKGTKTLLAGYANLRKMP